MRRTQAEWARAHRQAGFERYLAIRKTAEQVEEQSTRISYRHQVKAIPAASIAITIMRHLGAPALQMLYVQPVLHHLEALVYRGDLESEHNQLTGRLHCDTSWRTGAEQILHASGLADSATLSTLDELQNYFTRETAVMIARKPVDDDTIRDLCYQRASHFRLLLRAWHLALERPYDEAFFRIARHACARFEIVQDLHTYSDDLADDSFNLLRLEVWQHGTANARAHLDKLHRNIVRQLRQELAEAPRSTLLAAIRCFLIGHPGRNLTLIPTPLLRRYAYHRLDHALAVTEREAPTPVAEPTVRGSHSTPSETAPHLPEDFSRAD
ncbi:hypothetical protein [Streptomyces sp. NPDC049944]|uniref:hypothetical protein n=1 Tax=Streptomyces sp. NPDC049944 TaxID=3155657 RepID=UPI00343D4E26